MDDTLTLAIESIIRWVEDASRGPAAHRLDAVRLVALTALADADGCPEQAAA
jgi:hypothetical protein